MNISDKLKKDIYSLLNDSLKTANLEYEVVFKTYNDYYSISKPNFDKLHMLFRKAGYKVLSQDILIIYINDESDKEIGYRLYLEEKEDILSYYKKGIVNIKDKHYIDKKRRHDMLSVDNYQYRINVKYETDDLTDKERSYVYTQINNKSVDKTFRKKTLHSYSKDDSYFKIDLSILKQNDKPVIGKTLPKNIFNYSEHYEVEIELLNEKINNSSKLVDKTKLDNIYKEQINLTGNILKILQDTQVLMDIDEMNNVIEHYIKLGFPHIEKSKILSNSNRATYFGTRQPITLAKENMVRSLGTSTYDILSNYTVTEKADGEKMMLIVYNKNIYIMNKTYNLKKLKIRCNIDNCIIEGEYVKRLVYDDYIEYYLIYDAHIYDSNIIYNKKLINMTKSKDETEGGAKSENAVESDEESDSKSTKTLKSKKSKKSRVKPIKNDKITTSINKDSRLYYMHEFVNNLIDDNSHIIFKVKEFEYRDPNIFRNAFKVLKEHMFDYDIDGIIFTPDRALNDISDYSYNIFKWKPADENTIDFLVKFQGYDDKDHTNRYALCVGYAELTTVDPLSLIYKKERIIPDYNNLEYYPKIFDFAKFPTKDKKSFTTGEQEEIKNNMIIECLCVIDKNNNKSWIPKKIRWDKTKLYNTTNSIARTANDYSTTVKNIMSLINNPITEKMIIGEEEIKLDRSIDETYYTGNIPTLIEVNNYRAFQNFYGKEPLFQLFKKGELKLLDFACGQGGDMHKQNNNPNIKFVLGLDISYNNIYSGSGLRRRYDRKGNEDEDGTDSAYKRYMQELGYLKSKFRKITNPNSFLYAVMDLNKNMKYIQENGLIQQEYKDLFNSDLLNNATSTIYKYKSVNENNNYFIDLLFGILDKQEVKKEYPALKEYYNILNTNHFDLISSQFAVHYAFANRETLDNYCQNISNNLKKGGYFFGTTMDGYTVNEALDDKKIINGTINDNPIWSIKRKYVKYNKKDPERNIGLTISNYFHSIGKEYDEYLVDFNLLDKKMSEYGLEKLDDKDHKELGITNPKTFYYFKDIYNENVASGKIKIHKKGQTDDIVIDEQLLPYMFMYRRFIYKKVK